MNINATLINLYHVCKREMWLHANGIRMEHTSEVVADGKLIGETTYPQRADKYQEIELSFQLPDGTNLTGKVDYYDARNKVIHETKRSDSIEQAHEWQVKFYIWLLELNGIAGAIGTLEYPKLRHTSAVGLSNDDRLWLQAVVKQIALLIDDEQCPPRINSKICKRCSYYDFCYVEDS